MFEKIVGKGTKYMDFETFEEYLFK